MAIVFADIIFAVPIVVLAAVFSFCDSFTNFSGRRAYGIRATRSRASQSSTLVQDISRAHKLQVLGMPFRFHGGRLARRSGSADETRLHRSFARW